MIRKFAFWIVTLLIVSLGFIGWIHWQTLSTLHEKPSLMEPLFEKQKIISGLELSLEKYRRLSTNFRKASPQEVDQAKSDLKNAFSKGLLSLGQKAPSSEEQVLEKQIGNQLAHLLAQIAEIEPTFFSRDAYHNEGVLNLHEDLLKSLRELDRKVESRLRLVGFSSSDVELKSMISMLAAAGLIFALMIASLLRTYFSYVRPLNKLRDYAVLLGEGKPLPAKIQDFKGSFGELQKVLHQLSQGVETYKRDRHKFILDVVADLRGPLTLLQDTQAPESMRRGMSLVAGSLDDLNDIVDINRLDTRLDEKTIDLSELLSDASRMTVGSDYGKKITLLSPPIPVWAKVDVKRMERVLVLVLSKILDTITSPQVGLSIQLSLANQSSFRGIEILIREVDKQRGTKSTAAGGPDQDILRHWMSETGLGMLLAQKIVKAHGGTLMAAGVAGGSVSVTLRLPQERVISHGLISQPMETGRVGLTAGPLSPEVPHPQSAPGSGQKAKA